MIATSSPAARAAPASLSGSSEPVPRSTRIPPNARASWPITGASNTSFFPRKRVVRPERARAMPTASGSKYDRWLPHTMAGPDFGMFSVPAMSKRA
jgi:hypothetical protein